MTFARLLHNRVILGGRETGTPVVIHPPKLMREAHQRAGGRDGNITLEQLPVP